MGHLLISAAQRSRCFGPFHLGLVVLALRIVVVGELMIERMWKKEQSVLCVC